MTRLRCNECGWIGDISEQLTAPNPFEFGQVVACPRCKLVEELRVVCEVGTCTNEATCGTPTSRGYVRCCGLHYGQLRDWRAI